jgi:ubiquinone/menaquinone biosynthesis C-methylase UbiE/DNA-binding transcriptional ArsR family regulator
MESQLEQPDLVLGWLGGLADATRLRILRVLDRQELGVAELCDVLQMPQSTVSRHLKVLADLGWVRARRDGTTHLYRTLLDEFDPAARRLWLVSREQIDRWATTAQDQLRLQRLLQRRSSSQSFFAGAAAQWDNLRAQLYGNHFSSAAGLALLDQNMVVADLGCGTGPISAELAPFVGRIIGIDNSQAMLKDARRRLADFPNVELIRGELTSLPIETASCDAALVVLALTYILDPATAIAEAGRILKPGGKVVIVDLLPHDRDDFRRQMNQHWPGFDLEQVRRWSSEADLRITAAFPLPPEANVKGPALFISTATKPTESHAN